MAFQIVCQLALLVPSIGAIRSVARIAAFGASLYLFGAKGWSDRRRHPAVIPAVIALLIVGFSVFQPTTNTAAAGIAQFGLYLAILAPLFWIPALAVDPSTMWRTLSILWGFYSLSAAVGVLQVYFPGHFQFALSSVVATANRSALSGLLIETNSGAKVFRPMGLTDLPGGAAQGGLCALLIGVALLVRDQRLSHRVVFAASMILDLAAVALSQVRTVFVVILVGLAAFLFLQSIRNLGLPQRPKRATGPSVRVRLMVPFAVVAAVFLLAFGLAMSLAQKSVTERFSSLFTEKKTDLYYASRGFYLEQTVNELLPEYPFGAGLGRWGMMNYYFGDRTNLDSPLIYAEIQWTAWLLDGGIPLILAYVAALLVALWFAAKTSFNLRSRDLSILGTLIFAYDLAAIAETFDYIPFIGQAGLEFWFLNAMLFAAAREHARQQARANPR